MARAISRLLEVARQTERFHLLLLRALSLPGQVHLFVGRPLSRARVRASHSASLEGQWLTTQYSFLHDRRQHWWWCWSYNREGRAVARRLCRIHDDRWRRSHLLFPLHAFSRALGSCVPATSNRRKLQR